jgi:hypothetical protein
MLNWFKNLLRKQSVSVPIPVSETKSPDTDNPLAFYSTMELLDEIGRRSECLVMAYRPLVRPAPDVSWCMSYRGGFDNALGLTRRLWHSMDQDARRSAR